MSDVTSLILAIVGSAVGATWAIRSKLTDIEVAFARHSAEDEQKHAAMNARILRLETERGFR